jgi:hypothetical protein
VLSVRALRRRAEGLSLGRVFLGPLAALAAGLVLTTPQWLKNLIFYGDPAYPVLHRLFAPRPWTADSALRFDVGFTINNLWPAERSLRGLGLAFGSLLTFSFIPNDWEQFHGKTPVFGSLFTLGLLAMFFLRHTKRVWGLYFATQIGLFVWYWTNHQDRYLQAALPWMAAGTAAVLGLVWERGRAARVAACTLVALQLVWGADVYFMPGHVFLGVPAKAVIDVLSHTPGKPRADHLVYSDAFVAVGRALPPHAKPLIHEWHPHLGVGAPSVADCPYHQGGISYARTPTPREVYDKLSGFGVTHLVYKTTQAREPDTLAGETVFFNFVQRHAGAPTTADGWLVAAMPKEPPPEGDAPDPVLVVTCGKGLAPGLYHLADLAVPTLDRAKGPPRPFTETNTALAEMVPRANAVAQDHACTALPAGVEAGFKRAGTRDPFAIWVRK